MEHCPRRQNIKFLLERFPSLNLARSAGETGGTMPAVLNAANEVAVQYFLDELISFSDIPIIIESVLEQTNYKEAPTIDSILALVEEARHRAVEKIRTR